MSEKKASSGAFGNSTPACGAQNGCTLADFLEKKCPYLNEIAFSEEKSKIVEQAREAGE